MTFGEKIKEERIKQGLSQLELGEMMNVSQQAIAKYEKTIEQPKLSTVKKIANALNVDFTVLLAESDNTQAIIKNSMKEIIEDIVNDMDLENIEIKDVSEDLLFIGEAERRIKYGNLYKQLNNLGRDKAIEQVELLTKIPEYKNPINSEKNQDTSE